MVTPTSKMNMTNKMKTKQTSITNNKTTPPTAPQAVEQQLFKNQVKKTQLCRYYAAGICTAGTLCAFAHGDCDMRAPPDLSKTRICRSWLQGKCDKTKEECKFAHGRKDVNTSTFFQLRFPGDRRQKDSSGLGKHEVDMPPLPPKALKLTHMKVKPASDIDLNDTLSTCSGIDQMSNAPSSEFDENSDVLPPKTPTQPPKAKFVPVMSPVQQWLRYMTVFLATSPIHEKAKLVMELRAAAPDQYYD